MSMMVRKLFELGFTSMGHVGKWRMPLSCLQPDERVSEGGSIGYVWMLFCIHMAWVSSVAALLSRPQFCSNPVLSLHWFVVFFSFFLVFCFFFLSLSMSLKKSPDRRFCPLQGIFRGTVCHFILFPELQLRFFHISFEVHKMKEVKWL